MLLRQSYANENRGKYFIRWSFDEVQFIIVNVLLQNIIFGIILDSFAMLRQEEKEIEEERENNCFVCSFKRDLVS